MAPIKSSLARTVSKLLGVSKDTDLSLRGDVQINRRIYAALQGLLVARLILTALIINRINSHHLVILLSQGKEM